MTQASKILVTVHNANIRKEAYGGHMDPQLVSLDTITDAWHGAPRRWGHPLHSLCSYFAMFPPQLASVFIRWLTQPGDAVYDPFAGRGTVPLEAILHGRIGLGADANPLAHALTLAKIRIPSRTAVQSRLMELEEAYDAQTTDTRSVPADIRMLYSNRTLKQLVFLRETLGSNPRVDPFLTGMTLGMLHANHSSAGATAGFSVSMPNTFAMAPAYVRKYIARENLVAPDVNVFAMLRSRAPKYDLPPKAMTAGRSWQHDATKPAPLSVRRARPQLVFTSPPYLQVIKYGKYNWVRLWFLKHDAREVDSRLMASASLPRYLGFMTDVLGGLKQTVADDGYVCLVIGDVRKGEEQINLAGKVWRHVAEPAGWHCHGIIVDQVPLGQKVSRIWKNNPGRATKVDRLLLLSPSSTVALPDLIPVDWSETPSLVTDQLREKVA
jgi:site-specific DNA-methyltransferase (adenine-specific)